MALSLLVRTTRFELLRVYACTFVYTRTWLLLIGRKGSSTFVWPRAARFEVYSCEKNNDTYIAKIHTMTYIWWYARLLCVLHIKKPPFLPTRVVLRLNNSVRRPILTPLELQSRFGDKTLKFQVICPQLSPKRDCSPTWERYVKRQWSQIYDTEEILEVHCYSVNEQSIYRQCNAISSYSCSTGRIYVRTREYPHICITWQVLTHSRQTKKQHWLTNRLYWHNNMKIIDETRSDHTYKHRSS